MEINERHTIVIAAFVGFNWGRGFSAFGIGGGRATIWGDAASDDIVVAGTTTGGESGIADEMDGFLDCAVGCKSWECDNADIIARLWVGMESDEQGYRKGSRVTCWRRCILIMDDEEEGVTANLYKPISDHPFATAPKNSDRNYIIMRSQ
jgi:hypothetical protein